MSKVINPTENALEIQYRGIVYRVEALSEIDNVPAAAAEYWKTMIHNFIRIEEDSATPAPAEAPVEEAPAEEVVEESAPVEEPVEEPKKGKKAKK